MHLSFCKIGLFILPIIVRKICRPLQTVLDILDMFPEHREELLEMFDYKMSELKDPRLWDIDDINY